MLTLVKTALNTSLYIKLKLPKYALISTVKFYYPPNTPYLLPFRIIHIDTLKVQNMIIRKGQILYACVLLMLVTCFS